MKRTLHILTLAVCFLLPATSQISCSSTPQRKVHIAAGVISTTVENAMKGWNDYVGTGKASIEDEKKVKAAYEKYQTSMGILKSVVIAQFHAPEASTNLEKAVATVEAARVDLINLVYSFLR